MGTELIRCANCAGAVAFPPGKTITTCEYCGFQLQLSSVSGAAAAPVVPSAAGPTLATSVGLRAASGLLTAGTSVPTQHHETLSTQSDNQESITIELVNGGTSLWKVVFPLHARAPRGTVRVQLLLKIDAGGALTAFVTEQGTTNTTKHDGLRVELAG